ncbi:MAG: ModE family transcriptional regulator [Thalassobius sp.]|nr:ModE family transcriptional regulator [Thalassovita sp.]
MKNKELRIKCWVDIDGKKFFGPGPAQLLELIEQEGSLAKAAKQMGMSYKKAWDIIDDLNSRGQKPFVISHKGGKQGGGAELTDTGKKAIAQYRNLVQKLQTIIQEDAELLNII